MVSWLLNLIETICFFLARIDSVNVQSIMPKPVFLMTMQEAHKESNLMDQIRAKYEQLD